MEQKATIEDIDRTRGRILSAYENGHGIELSPQEVERLVGMMMSMEVMLVGTREQLQQTQQMLAGTLNFLEQNNYKLEFHADDLLGHDVTGWVAEWDEKTNVISFDLEHGEPDEPGDAEVEQRCLQGHDPADQHQQRDAHDERQDQADAPRSLLLVGRQPVREDGDEDEVVDAEHDLERHQRHEGEPRCGIAQKGHDFHRRVHTRPANLRKDSTRCARIRGGRARYFLNRSHNDFL